MARTTEWVCVAAVATAHGIRGALKLRCFTGRPEDAVAYGPVYDKQGKRLFALKAIGQSRGGLLVEAEGVRDRNAAEALRGTELFVPRAVLPDLEPDEFYHSDLQGLEVRRTDGARLGVVRGLDNFGAGDILDVLSDDGRTFALPFDRATVRRIDLEQGLVVEPPAELVGPEPATAHGAEAGR